MLTRRLFWVVLTGALLALLIGLAACGGRRAALTPDPTAPETTAYSGPVVAATLAEAMSHIEDAEKARQASSLPDSVPASQPWVAGPDGTFVLDNGAQTATLTSQGTGPDDPNYISFAIYRMPGHLGDAVGRLQYSADLLGQEYWIYVVDYTGTAAWQSYGPFTTGSGGPAELALGAVQAVSGNGNVYVAFAAYGNSTLTVNSVGISQELPQFYEIEDNDSSAQATALPAFPFEASLVVGSLGPGGNNYDGDKHDWYSFAAPGPGRVHIGMAGFQHSNADLDLQLIDTDGTTELDRSSGTGNGEFIEHLIPAAGTYYVHCFVYNDDDEFSDYGLFGRWLPDNSAYYESEPNDAAAQANPLPAFPFPPTIINGSVGTGGADHDGSLADWYSFELTSAQIVSLEFLRDSDSGNATWELIESDGVTVIVERFPTVYGEMTALLQPGTYYVRVFTAIGHFDYELRGTTRPQDPGIYTEVEDNDIPAQSNALPAFPFTGYNGSVGQGGGFYDGDGEDWFSFSLTEQKVAIFNVERTVGTGGGSVELLEADGTTVRKTDTTVPFNISDILPAGSYYLRVTASAGNGFDYRISGTAQTPGEGYFEVENNDVPAEATVLPALPFTDTNVNGSIGLGGGYYDGDQVDWWRLEVGEASVVEVRMTVTEGTATPKLELYAADGTTLLDEHRSGTQYYIGDTLTAGTYYVKVHTTSSTSYFEYYLQGFIHDPDPGLFYEAENNDSVTMANALPAFPFGSVRGSAGNAPSRYDGDHADWYSFTIGSGGLVTIDMSIDDHIAGDIDMRMYDADGTTQRASSTGVGDSESMSYNFPGPGTYFVYVYVHRGGSDYTLNGTGP